MKRPPGAGRSKDRLTPKQEMFCKEYLVDLNAAQAAIRAGYSKKTAYNNAYGILTKVAVQKRIQVLMNRRAERAELNSDFVLHRLMDECQADIGDIFTPEGALKSIHDWPEIFRIGLVQGLDVDQLKDKDGTVYGSVAKIKFDNRIKRLELLGRHLKLFVDKTEHSVDDGLKEILKMIKPSTGLPSEQS